MNGNWCSGKFLNMTGNEENGIFYYNKKKEISYPEYGNDEYFGIEDNSFWFGHRNRCIKEITKLNGIKGEIADIGGGNGFVSMMLQDIGLDVILVEPGEKGVINAKKRGVKKIVCGIFDRDMFNDKIDNIGLFDVLEHIEHDEKFLEDIYSVIKENGKIILTVPAFNILWSNEDDEVGHYRRYRLSEIEKIVTKAGFKIEYSNYLFSFLWLPLFLFRTLPTIFGIRRKSSERRVEKEHQAGIIGRKILNWFESAEIRKILLGKKNCWGTSCIIVAKKQLV